MIAWAADRLEAYRSRSWPWRALGVGLALVVVIIAGLVIAWRRRSAAAREHEAFVANVDAREAETRATIAAAEGRVGEFTAAAAAAGERAKAADARSDDARRKHDEDLAAIDRVRTWRDIRPR